MKMLEGSVSGLRNYVIVIEDLGNYLW